MNPYLQFNFKDPTGKKTNYAFYHPLKILETRNITEVKAIFQQIETALNDGYYVAGYVSYEAAPAFNDRYSIHSNPQLPLVWFAIYDQPHKETVSQSRKDYAISNWALTSNYDEYQDGITTIKNAIEHGNTYQVNYTTRLEANFSGDDYSFFKQLTLNQEAPYSAYLNIGQYRILSASPELFFHVKNNKITTKPMKGTAKRGRYPKEDSYHLEHLKNSQKEQAENLMIVDLLRNDVGKLAKPGSVKVPKLFEIETYPTVHQMTSTIEAELRTDTTVFDWFKALFPCGSITGAPKIRTMDYIAELEQSPREVYCGAVGFITPQRDATFNVPIRTVIIDKDRDKAIYGVGSGITWDSTVDGEYEELFTKARLLTEERVQFQLLESLSLVDGNFPLLNYHIDRLLSSGHYFNFTPNRSQLEKCLNHVATTYTKGHYKVRLLVDRNNNLSTDLQAVRAIQQPLSCVLAKSPVDINDPFLYHKTTNRKLYEKHQLESPSDTFSVLLWNEKQELTEFTIGNLVVEDRGQLYTPPIACGLLNGTYRQHMLDQGVIKEKILKKDDLNKFDKIWFINSVRGWLQVDIKNSDMHTN